MNNQPHKNTNDQSKVQLPFIQYPRSAGVLLHITSLSSPFGVGDFGPKAYEFADFLKRADQTVWQLLPINSTSSAQGFSPYGSDGTFAGNVLLISAELLVKDGLLTNDDLAEFVLTDNGKTDYKNTEKINCILLEKAFQNFVSKQFSQTQFQLFCKKESDWLTDYSLYIVLKKSNQNKSWNEWEDQYKNRNTQALKAFADKHSQEMEEVKWQQWIFEKQWFALKEYCNGLGIKLFGDVSFYVAYDSADVWKHRNLFNLDENGTMLSEGGAPPDDFNADGQRWGMPVYRWDVIKENHYDWWLKRIKKNMVQFDLVRLDHFRGFSAYWDIPKVAKSAKEGTWKRVNGEEFFTLLQNETGTLPLVAEDLGTIDEPVIQLRNQFQIPGMIIQQVGFGEDMPQSKSITHHHTVNSVVYTGNHDNNTILGWYKSLPPNLKKNVSTYTNRTVTSSHVCDVMRHLVYASVARLAILPMQDILELDEGARMNSVPDGGASWSWRMKPEAINKKTEKLLQNLCYVFDRKRIDVK